MFYKPIILGASPCTIEGVFYLAYKGDVGEESLVTSGCFKRRCLIPSGGISTRFLGDPPVLSRGSDSKEAQGMTSVEVNMI